MDPLSPLLSLPGVAEAAEASRKAVDKLLTHRSMRKHATQVAVEAGLRCATASASLEAGEVLQGALRISAELRPLVETWEHAPLQALARMHTLAAAGLVPDEALGRPSSDVSARLATLVSVLETTSVPAVLVAGVVHGELLSLDAFEGVNGIVARAAARIVLVARGLDPRGVSVPDAGVARDQGRYVDAANRFAVGEVAPFLLLWCDAVAHGAVEGIAIGEALLRS